MNLADFSGFPTNHLIRVSCQHPWCFLVFKIAQLLSMCIHELLGKLRDAAKFFSMLKAIFYLLADSLDVNMK